MAVKDQTITDQYALYNGDCIDVMKGMPDKSISLSVYSPPFGGLYCYSSDPQDLSNSIDRDEFFTHFGFVIGELARITMPGRLSFVHAMDFPMSNAGCDEIYDFPGDIIRAHKEHGFGYAGRRVIWKEPLLVRNRTMMKSLHHSTLCKDATKTSIANADYLLMFRRAGENAVPVNHSAGLLRYAGEREMPANVLHHKGMEGDQKFNTFSQWIWRQYASSIWDDIRIDHVLSHRDAKEPEDEKHVHPLQLDVIERACVLGSNPGETVLTPFMGVGSEVYGAVVNGRKGIGIELKPTYYNQAVKNVATAEAEVDEDTLLPGMA